LNTIQYTILKSQKGIEKERKRKDKENEKEPTKAGDRQEEIRKEALKKFREEDEDNNREDK